MALRARTDPLLNARIEPALAIPPKDRVYGPGAGYVMAPFAYPSPDGTRFGPPALTADSFGVYYAARDEATAIAEVKHHRIAFLEAMRAPAQDLDFEVLKAPVKGAHFYDLRDRQRDFPDVYSPTDYSASQKLGIELQTPRRRWDRLRQRPPRRRGMRGRVQTALRWAGSAGEATDLQMGRGGDHCGARGASPGVERPASSAQSAAVAAHLTQQLIDELHSIVE